MSRRDTDWVRRYWDRSAGAYDRSIGFCEGLMLGDGRRWIGWQARGDVLEIGVGTGRNLAEYPADARLAGLDLSPEMLRRARERAAKIGRDVELSVGDAQQLDYPDDRFDTVVFSLALCSIPDDRAAVHEAKRVLRPGGRLVLLESDDHLRPVHPRNGACQLRPRLQPHPRPLHRSPSDERQRCFRPGTPALGCTGPPSAAS